MKKMNIYNNLNKIIQKIVKEEIPLGADVNGELLDRINVEPPKDPTHGDFSSNAALVLSKTFKSSPRELALEIGTALKDQPGIENVEIAGPGFINIWMTEDFWRERLIEILSTGESYGDSDLGNHQTINIEFVSANPTGPMHVGHGRGAVLGDAIGNLLEKIGFRVLREYYINDAGAQVDTLARSVFLRYRQALGQRIDVIPEGLYPGEYLIETGRKIADRDGDQWTYKHESEWLDHFKRYAISEMMDLIKSDLSALGVTHEVFVSEKALIDSGAIETVLEQLKARDLLYTGTLEPPKGKVREDWEERPQLLFAATKFNDEIDRPLQKSDGSNTYFASDIAYHKDKFDRGFNRMIDVWGADHKGYVARMKAAVEAVTDANAVLEVSLCNLVNLLDDGEPVKMSKRAGTFVTLREVIDLVGKDVVRFMMLTRNNEALLDFDVSKVTEQSKDNPVFYVQYAHARICSVIRNVRAEFKDLDVDDLALAQADFDELDNNSGLGLVQLLTNWPRIVEGAALSREPHRVAFYLNELAAAFHAFWNKGNDDESLRFIVSSSPKKTLARVALARSVAIIIESGLKIIGVKPAEEMR